MFARSRRRSSKWSPRNWLDTRIDRRIVNKFILPSVSSLPRLSSVSWTVSTKRKRERERKGKGSACNFLPLGGRRSLKGESQNRTYVDTYIEIRVCDYRSNRSSDSSAATRRVIDRHPFSPPLGQNLPSFLPCAGCRHATRENEWSKVYVISKKGEITPFLERTLKKFDRYSRRIV